MLKPEWVTNNPKAARLLMAADKAYDDAVAAAANLCLAEKIIVFRQAKHAHIAAYGSVAHQFP